MTQDFSMVCCAHPQEVEKSAIVSEHGCKTWCDINVQLCGAYEFSNGKCHYCDNVHITESTENCFQMLERRSGIPKEKQQCFSNKCLACPGGEILNVTHNTSILFSQFCNRYLPFETAVDSPLIFLDFNTSAVPLNGVNVIGPGKIQSNLPIRLGTDFSFVQDIHFFSCEHEQEPAAAAVVTSKDEAGKIMIEGHVDRATANSLFMTEPSTVGGEVFLSENSFITMTTPLPGISSAAESVGIAALAHVTGHLNLTCSSSKQFVVVQSLTASSTTNYVEKCSVVNLTDLLSDFGREYEIQFFDGPEKPSALSDAITYLFLILSVLAIVTFIFNQTKISRLSQKLFDHVLK